MDPKQHLYNFCNAFITERINRIEKGITALQESLRSETKSSAGDKHETGRAMVQLEREKLGTQLAEAEKQKQLLLKVPLHKNTNSIGLGSWVHTSKGNYFLAISAGETHISGTSTYCISLATPIGKMLLGSTKGDTVVINGRNIQVLEVF